MSLRLYLINGMDNGLENGMDNGMDNGLENGMEKWNGMDIDWDSFFCCWPLIFHLCVAS